MGLGAVRLSEREGLWCSVVRKRSRYVRALWSIIRSAVCRFSERQKRRAGLNVSAVGRSRESLEGVNERLAATVDKSRQGSHSLLNANVCEMFHCALGAS